MRSGLGALFLDLLPDLSEDVHQWPYLSIEICQGFKSVDLPLKSQVFDVGIDLI